MFTVQAREHVRGAILAMARSDPRVVGGALIGSLAAGPGDRCSDLDLGFDLAAGASPTEVLADWTARLGREFQAVHLFDLASLSTTYRVFLLGVNLRQRRQMACSRPSVWWAPRGDAGRSNVTTERRTEARAAQDTCCPPFRRRFKSKTPLIMY